MEQKQHAQKVEISDWGSRIHGGVGEPLGVREAISIGNFLLWSLLLICCYIDGRTMVRTRAGMVLGLWGGTWTGNSWKTLFQTYYEGTFLRKMNLFTEHFQEHHGCYIFWDIQSEYPISCLLRMASAKHTPGNAVPQDCALWRDSTHQSSDQHGQSPGVCAAEAHVFGPEQAWKGLLELRKCLGRHRSRQPDSRCIDTYKRHAHECRHFNVAYGVFKALRGTDLSRRLMTALQIHVTHPDITRYCHIMCETFSPMTPFLS